MKIIFLDGYTINPGDLSWDLLDCCGDLTVYDRTAPHEVMERAVDADILIVNKTPLTREHFEALPNLKLVCVAATGYDKIDIAAARQHGIHVCNCAGYSSQAVAQMAVALILEVADSVGNYSWRNREGDWSRSADFCYTTKPRLELAGKTLGIVGFGNIGEAIARIMQAMGMHIVAVSSKSADQLPQNVTKVSLAEAFAQCDIISLNCPLNAENKEFVNASLLAKSNPNLILVNTARGGLINEKDVANALHNNQLLAYCADVMTQEPPAPDNELLLAPRTFITPHIAWNTPEARQRILHILNDNIESFKTGKPKNVVN